MIRVIFFTFITILWKLLCQKKEKERAVPEEMLTKEFLSQFKTEQDVSKFLKKLHAQVLEQMLQGEMDAPLVTRSTL